MWAKGEGEGEKGDLENKLVDESTGSSKPAPASAAAASASAAESDVESVGDGEDSSVWSRTLCFFRFLSVLTVLLALVVIGTNCYIIYERADDIKGE